MALSGTISSAYRGWTYQIKWKASQSIDNNQSTITCTHELVCDDGYDLYISSRSNSCTVDGSSKSFTSPSISTGGGKTISLGETKHTVTHASDGSKSATISGTFNIKATLSGTYKKSITASKSVTLDTIPRKSTLSVADGTLGTAQTLNITEKASAFYHKLYYSCGSVGGYILGSSNSTSSTLSISWTPPVELAKQNTTGTSVSIKFTLYTYTSSSGTLIGSNSYTKTFSIPSSVKPSCEVAVSDEMGYLETYGAYIKGLSKFKVVVTPEASYDSAIASYSTTANGGTYTAASFITDILKSSGTLEINATVKDKRGRTGSASTTATVLDYVAPAITLLKVMRCDADGNEDLQGEYVNVTFDSNVTALNNKNKVTYKLEYKKSVDSTYTAVTLEDYSNNYVVSNGTYIFAADTGFSYNVKLIITDAFYSTEKPTVASTAHAIMHFHSSGKGLGIGKTAETEEWLDVAYKAKFRDNIASANGFGLRGLTTDGKSRSMAYLSDQDNMVFGNGSYYYQEGIVYYYGHNINIKANESITSNKTITVSSDRRLKENIARFEDAAMFSNKDSDIYIKLFDKLQPVSFNYIDGNGKVCFGFIAQDVIEVLNELGIDENELDLINEVQLEEGGEKTYGIAYGNLHALQIHKIKKLEERIAKLENIVEQLVTSKTTLL